MSLLPSLLMRLWLFNGFLLGFSKCSVFVNKNHVDLKVTALVGRNATLECPAQERDEHKVAWIKQESRTILSLHGELVTQSKRYDILRKELGSYDLLIANVKESDAGTYICQINSNPMKNLVIFLYVVKSPEIKPIMEENVNARVGQTVRMECQAEGIPQPTISWKKFGKRGGSVLVAENTNSFEIRKVTHKDVGKYMCIANNGYPPSVGQAFHVFVLAKPVVKMTVKRVASHKFKVVCKIEAHPRPSDFSMNCSDFSTISDESSVRGFLVIVSGEIVVDRGEKVCMCEAQNIIGKDVKSLALQYSGPYRSPTETLVSLSTWHTTESPETWTPSASWGSSPSSTRNLYKYTKLKETDDHDVDEMVLRNGIRGLPVIHPMLLLSMPLFFALLTSTAI